MQIPARILRAQCDEIPGQRPILSFKEQDRQTRIMDAAQAIMAHHGRGAISMNQFARAMRLSPATIHRHFPDMHYLLAQILHRHLAAIARALGEVPQNSPNRTRARRAAYLAATRVLGAPTEAHLLLIRDRHLLPPDQREPLEDHRASIGLILAGDNAQAALSLLDNPELTAPEIEAALTAITAARQAPAKPTNEPPRPKAAPSRPAPALRPTHPDPNDAVRPRAGPH